MKDDERQVRVGQAIGLGVVGALISFAFSWRPSYWYDEAATLSAIDRSPSQLWDMLEHKDAVHGVYYFVMQGWVQVFGTSEVATRLFSVLGIGLTCAGVSLLGQRLGGLRLGLAAGLIAAVLPGLSWAGVETRQYSWSAALAVLATTLLLRAVDSDRASDWVYYSFAIAGATYVFLFCALLIPAHLVTLLMLRGRVGRWSLATAGSLVLAGPLLVQAWSQRGQVNWIDYGPVELLGRVAFGQFFLGRVAGDGLTISAPFAVLLFALSAGLVVAALRASSSDPAKSRVLAIGLPWAVVPTLLLVIYSLLVSPMYTLRYTTLSAPGLAVVLGYGLLQLRAHQRVFEVAGALMLLLSLPILVLQKAEDAKGEENYRELAAAVGSDSHAVNGVIFSTDAASGVWVAYPDAFDGVKLLNLSDTAAESGTLWDPVLPVGRLDPSAIGGSRVGLILATDGPLDRNRYARWLRDRGCEAGSPTEGPRFSVYVFSC